MSMLRKLPAAWLPLFLLPLLLLLLAAPPALAAEAPDAMVKSVTNEVLDILRADKEIRSGNRQRAIALIEEKVAPHFDFTRMTGLAVGRAWNDADAAQKAALTEAFRTLLVRTYANSLSAYSGQTVAFKPSPPPDGNGEVIVRSQVHRPGKPEPVSLDYSLARQNDEWKVFDVVIAGVSLVTNYRSNFASEISKGGLDGLLEALREKNRRLQAAAPAA